MSGEFAVKRLEGGGRVAVLILQRHRFEEEVESVGDVGHGWDAGLEHRMLVGDFINVDLVTAARADVIREADVAALSFDNSGMNLPEV